MDRQVRAVVARRMDVAATCRGAISPEQPGARACCPGEQRTRCGRLTVNARATRGAVFVRLLDPAGNPLDEPGAAEARPLDGDLLAGEVRWHESLERGRGKPVRLEFRLHRAAMFGFEFSA